MPGITPIDSSIPLQLKDPVQTYGDLMKAQDTASQSRYRDAQAPLVQQQTKLAAANTQAAELANTQAQNDLEDQRKLKDHIAADPRNAEAIGRGDYSGVTGLGLQPKTLFGLQKWSADARESMLKVDSATLKNHADEATAVQNLLESVKTEEDPAKRKELALNGFNNLQRAGQLKGISFPAEFDGSDESLNRFAAQNGLSRGMMDKELKRRQEEADLAAKQATAPKTIAETGKAQAEAAKIAAETPGASAKSQQEQIVTANMSPDGLTPQQKVEQQHGEATLAQAEAQMKETSRYHQQEINLKQQENARAQQIYESTYGSGANPALQGVEPKMRTAAAAQAQKAGLAYNQAQSSAEEMKSIIDLARNGNKVAYAYAPTTGVLTINTANGVKRVNMAEIHSYAGAGSAVDKVEGWLMGHATGESIPPQILNDMEKLHGQISANSYKKYNDDLTTTNNTYRSNFTPATPPPASLAPPAIKAGDFVIYNGAQHKVKTIRPDGKLELEP